MPQDRVDDSHPQYLRMMFWVFLIRGGSFLKGRLILEWWQVLIIPPFSNLQSNLKRGFLSIELYLQQQFEDWMNSQNPPSKNTSNRPNLPDNVPRYGYPTPHTGVIDPYMMMNNYLLQPQMQMMLKWRNQMAQLVRSQQVMPHPYQFIDPTPLSPYAPNELPNLMLNSPEAVYEKMRREYPAYQMKPPKMNEQMYQYSPFPMMPPSINMPHPNKEQMRVYQASTSPHPNHHIQEKRKPINKQKFFSVSMNKQPHVIVIDEQQDVIPQVIPQQIKSVPLIQQAPPVISQKSIKPLKAPIIATKKSNVVPETVYAKKSPKPLRKVSSDQKLEEDSFKPSGFRSKKIEKKRIKLERERTVRHRETEREKALKEKKLTQEQKAYQSKPNDQQGKIMISSFHQAKIPEFKFGSPQNQKQKQRKRESLMLRLEFQGSSLREQYKRLKQAVPTWPSNSLLNILKHKFGSLPLQNKGELSKDQKNQKSGTWADLSTSKLRVPV